MAAPGAPLISVVVPTRDRPQSLRRCLAALERQRHTADIPTLGEGATPLEGLEIVVVDDRSGEHDAVRDVVGEARSARLLTGSGRGPAAVRNAGAAAARADIVCFTDDDCEPEPGWASGLAAAIGRGADAVAGQTVNADPADRLAEASQHIANYLGEYSRRAGVPFAASNNLACRAEVIREIAFDESYPLAAGEDRAWCAELAARGFELIHEPGAIVHHRQRLRWRAFWRQHSRYGRGAYRFGRERGGALPSPAGLYPRLLGAAFARGFRVGAFVCLAQVATAVGFVAAAVADRRATYA
jgi:glycosyltransferase involved in cell wall biosynthesis